MNNIIIISENHVFTTSLLIAEKFNKNHFHVLRDIRNLGCSESFRQSNFGLTFHDVRGPNNSVRKADIYHITRDGFAFLAMGFTGKEAAHWKVQFIDAFNQMERFLNQSADNQHHAILNTLFMRHPQWQQTQTLRQQGVTITDIARLQNKHPRSVSGMLRRMKTMGLDCNPQDAAELKALTGGEA